MKDAPTQSKDSGIFDSKRPFFRAHFGARLWRMEHLDFRFLPVLGTANPFSSGDFERAEVVKAINLVSLLPQFKPAVPGRCRNWQ